MSRRARPYSSPCTAPTPAPICWRRRLAVVSIGLIIFSIFSLNLRFTWAQVTDDLANGFASTVEGLPTEAELTAQLEAVRAATDLTEEARASHVTNLLQAQQDLASISKWQEASSRYQAMISGQATEAARVAADLERSSTPRPLIPSNPSRSDLERLQTETDAALVQATAEFDALSNEPTRRQQRLTEIPTLLSTLRDELSRTQNRLAEPPPAGEIPLVTSTRVQTLQVRLTAITAQIAGLELESLAYTATTQLLPRQQELAAKRKTTLESQKRMVDDRLRQLIATDAAEQIRQATAAAEQVVPELKTLAERVVDLLIDNASQQRDIERLSLELQQLETQQQSLKADLDYIRKRLDTVGLTTGLGALLRSKRSETLRIRAEEDPDQSDQEELRSTQLKIFEVQEYRQALLGDSSYRQKLIDEITKQHPNRSPDEIATEVDFWLRRELDELARLETTCQTYFERWVAVDAQRHELRKRCDEFIRYVEERVLWVKSADSLGPGQLPEIASDVQQLLSWQRWQRSVPKVLGHWPTNLFFLPLCLSLLLLIGIYRSRLRRVVIEAGKQAAKRSCQELRPTWIALGGSLVLGSLWPLLLLLLGLRLQTPTDETWFLNSIGEALVHTAWFLWPIELLRQLTRPDGLGEHHFGWPKAARIQLRQATIAYGLVAPVLFFIAQSFYMLQEHARLDQEWNNQAGRVAFILLLITSLVTTIRIFHPTRGVMTHLEPEHRKSLWYRGRYLLTFGLPVGLTAMIVLSVIGYYYSSIQLAFRAFQSLSFLLVIAIISATLRRWLFIRRRRLAMKQYRDRLESLRNRTDSQKSPSESIALELPSDSEVDLVALSEQTRQLIHFFVVLVAVSGVFAIWIDVLPALGVFGKLPIWETTRAGEVVQVTVEKMTVALLTSVVMFVAVKNLPALLEIMLLQHLPIDAGARFAIVTITRYAVLIIGSITVLSTLEIEWAKYSWLVAAATVGLGFGLQEIFANFISGLIMLVERPCKVGDVVTVDGVTGVVSRIQMRATTVTNWDRQDLIVPNKEFVTGKLLNWTLANAVNRVVIPIGVAYGSNPEKVTQLLIDITAEHPDVMKEPAPTVTFESFGASSLDFVLRCFLPTLDRRLSVIHELHSRIDQVFRAEGIEIAFPQQDLHLRSIDDQVLDRIHRSSPEGTSETSPSDSAGTAPDTPTA